MLAAILSILGSTGFGSALGWIGGFLNRKIDLAAKKAEYDFKLSLRDKDLEQTKAEVAGQVAVADREVDEAKALAHGQIEAAAYAALGESYKTQFGGLSKKYEIVEAISKLIRPVVTLMFVLFSMSISVYVIYKAMNSGVTFTVAEWKEWLTYIIHWVFFQAGVVIGWWFANRPSGQPAK